MKISFIYVTHRSGTFDILASWFARQACADAEHELVVVDGSPMRVKSGKVLAYLRQMGIPVGWYGEPKPRTFPWSTSGYANAVNTGLLRATGTHAVICHDLLAAPHDSLVRWHVSFSAYPDSLICGDASVCDAAGTIGTDDVRTWEALTSWTTRDSDGPTDFRLGFWGGPINLFERFNGLDERSDFCHGWALDDLKAKARLLGCGLLLDKGLPYGIIDHSGWSRPHDFSTVYHLNKFADVPFEPEWTEWSANSIHLANARAKLANARAKLTSKGVVTIRL